MEEGSGGGATLHSLSIVTEVPAPTQTQAADCRDWPGQARGATLQALRAAHIETGEWLG